MSSTGEATAVPFTQRFASLGILALILVVLASIAIPQATIIAGILAMVALVGSALISTSRTRAIVMLLAGLGFACMIVSITVFGAELTWSQLGQVNQDIVAMISGGAFVRGVFAASNHATKTKLKGAPAVFRTALVTQFFSSVLNMVTIGVVGDHLQRKGRLSVNNAALVTQAYSTAALWSPFWSVTAIIVAYFPAISILPVSITGFTFSIVFLLLASLWNVRQRSPEELREQGYSLDPRALLLPVALIAAVITGSILLADAPIPRLVLLAALVVPFIFGVVRSGPRETVRRFTKVATSGLTASANEASLFIAAGIFSVGGAMLTVYLPFQLSNITPSVFTAWLLVVVMVLLAVVGVHPIVSVSLAAATAFLVPSGAFLYAAAIFWGWCISATVGPLAGIIIYASQRYSISDRLIIKANLPFAALGLALAFPAIYAVQQLALHWNLA